MYGFSTSGRPIAMDRKVYDDYIGGPDPNIPYWKDIQAGRLRPGDVDPCVPTPSTAAVSPRPGRFGM